MKTKLNSFLLMILIIVLLGGFWWLYNSNLIQNSTYITTNEFKDHPTDTTYCDLQLSTETACIDEEVTATIKTYANGVCDIYFSYNGGEWKEYDRMVAGSTREIIWTDSAQYEGRYKWGAICTDLDNICRTNDEVIIINDCSSPDTPDPTCTDTDGGMNYNIQGICESSATMTGEIDTCSGNIINEKFCTPTGYCETVSIPCPAPFNVCIDGRCMAI